MQCAPQAGAEAAARADGDDVSAHITAWGLWEAGWIPPVFRGPTSMSALLSALSHPDDPAAASGAGYGRATAFDPSSPLGFEAAHGTLIDVSAGPGLFSLAAAARGLRVLAVEPEEPNRRLLEASVRMNGWEGLVAVFEDPVGASEGAGVCVRTDLGLAALEASGRRDAPYFDNENRRWNQTDAALMPWTLGAACGPGQRPGTQRTLDRVAEDFLALKTTNSSIHQSPSPSVLRIGHGAAEVISGAGRLLGRGVSGPSGQHLLPPTVVLLELHAYKLSAAAALVDLLEQRHGYTGGMFHTGALCRASSSSAAAAASPAAAAAAAATGASSRASAVSAPPGRRWCRCKPGRFKSAIGAGRGAYSDGSRSLTVAMLRGGHEQQISGERWLGMMIGSSIGACVV